MIAVNLFKQAEELQLGIPERKISQSNARVVALRDVQRDLTGFYKCEVSADAPLFHTEIKSGLMIVVDIPQGDPSLFVEKTKYQMGEKIRANCTSKPSYPAGNLTWFVNGHQVVTTPHTSTVFPVVVTEADGMEVAFASVELEAASHMFREGKLKLRCLATIFTLYRHSKEIVLTTEDSPQLAPVMGATAPHSLDLGCRMECSAQMVFGLTVLLFLLNITR